MEDKVYRVSKTVTFGAANGDGKYQAAAATLSTALTGDNNDLDYTADATGKAGNDISVAYVDPGTAGASLSVEVDDTDITVNLATAAAVKASYTTSLTGDDNDLVFTARQAGAAGNNTTVAYVDPEGVNPLKVSVSGTAISVQLATLGTAKAAGVLTSTATNPANNDTVTIGTTVYTFKTNLSAAGTAGEVKIGTAATNTLDNLKSAINGTVGRGVTYGKYTVAHPLVVATTKTDTTLEVEAINAGTQGNSIATTDVGNQMSWGASALAGGTSGIISTADQVKKAVQKHPQARFLVSVAFASANDGTGIVTALAAQNLAGGAGGAITTTSAQIITAIEASTAAAALVNVANKAGNTGAGVVTALARTNLAGGADGVTKLFNVDGTCLVTINGHCSTDLAGASATLAHGTAVNSTLFTSALVATDIDKYKTIDKTGIVAVGTAPNATPHATLTTGDVIQIDPAVANITGGVITYVCYYKPQSAYASVTVA